MDSRCDFNSRTQIREITKRNLRAKDGLSVVSQSPEEAHDGPSALRVQSGGWFVQEQKKFRLGGEFNRNGQPLPLLNTQGTDDSVRIFLQTAHQETPLDICLLLSHGDILRLTKNGRKEDRLADGRSGLVGIHLLTVSGLGLEIGRKGLAAHEPVAGHDTNGRALGKDVQKGSLFFEVESVSSDALNK